LKAEERVQAALDQVLIQPYRDLWKLFQQAAHRSRVRFLGLLRRAHRCLHRKLLIVPILIPVLTDRPLPISDMADMLGWRMVLTLGPSPIYVGRIRQRETYTAGSGRADLPCWASLPEPILILVLVGHQFLAKAMLPFVVNHTLLDKTSVLLEPNSRLSVLAFLIAPSRDRPSAHSFQYAY